MERENEIEKGTDKRKDERKNMVRSDEKGKGRLREIKRRKREMNEELIRYGY